MRLFAAVFVTLVFASFQTPGRMFAGKIVYQFRFRDAQGHTITDSLSPVLGKAQFYFVNGSNYKAYNEKNELTELYNGRSNTFYGILPNRIAQKMSAATAGSSTFIVTRLSIHQEVAGYRCDAIRVVTDDASTTYFYTPLIKVDPAAYAHHNLGDWNKVLKATHGALPLKFIIVNYHQAFMEWTMTATKVVRQPLADSDFELPAGIHPAN